MVACSKWAHNIKGFKDLMYRILCSLTQFLFIFYYWRVSTAVKVFATFFPTTHTHTQNYAMWIVESHVVVVVITFLYFLVTEKTSQTVRGLASKLSFMFNPHALPPKYQLFRL